MAGGLMSYGPNYLETKTRAGGPADLAVKNKLTTFDCVQ